MPTSLILDAVTVVALDDGEEAFFRPRTSAFPDATAEQWRRADARDPGAVRDGKWWVRYRCFAFVRHDQSAILVDAGVGPASAGAAHTGAPALGRLPDELAEAGIARQDVGTVVLTHMHSDHIGWSMDADGAPYFPNARYILQRTEVEAIKRQRSLAAWLLDPLRETGLLSEVDGDAALDANLRVVPTPGHTPGHQSVLLETASGTLVATGDVLVHTIQLVDPHLAYVYEMNADTARASRVALLHELSRRGNVRLATPHLGEPFITLAASP